MKKADKKVSSKYLIFLAVLITVFITVLAIAIFGSGKDSVIAKAGDKKILYSQYRHFLTVSAEMDRLDNVNAVMMGLSIAGYLETAGVLIGTDTVAEEYAGLTEGFFSENGEPREPYGRVLSESGISEDNFRAALRNVASVNAAESALDSYISDSHKKQDPASSGYIEDFSSYRNKIRLEAESGKASLVYGGEAVSVNGVTPLYSGYSAYIDFSTGLYTYQLIEAVALYQNITDRYGSNADISGFTDYFDNIKRELKADETFSEALGNTGVSENDFFMSAQSFYRNVYVYEELEEGFFLERYNGEDASLGYESYEDYLSYQLMNSASACEVIKFDFSDEE